jgi:hypothetical protein
MLTAYTFSFQETPGRGAGARARQKTRDWTRSRDNHELIADKERSLDNPIVADCPPPAPSTPSLLSPGNRGACCRQRALARQPDSRRLPSAVDAATIALRRRRRRRRVSGIGGNKQDRLMMRGGGGWGIGNGGGDAVA